MTTITQPAEQRQAANRAGSRRATPSARRRRYAARSSDAVILAYIHEISAHDDAPGSTSKP